MTLRAVLIVAVACALAALADAQAFASGGEPLRFEPRGQTAERFASPDLSRAERVYVRAHEDSRGDRILLHARVLRPNRPPGDPLRPANEAPYDPDWETPVVLIHSPYNQAGLYQNYTGCSASVCSPGLLGFLVRRGYTVVVSDIRGTGSSGGCFERGTLDQARDFATLVEHFAAQSWANGKVGAIGLSEHARAPLIGATLPPPRRPHGRRGRPRSRLAAIIPVSGFISEYDFLHHNGVPAFDEGSPASRWASYTAQSHAPGADPANATVTERRHCEPDNVQAALDMSGTMTPYYRARNFRERAPEIRASVLLIHGLRDTTVWPWVLSGGWYDRIPSFKRAVLGHWSHRWPDTSDSTYGRDDFRAMVHAWFDRWLLGLDTGVESWPAVQVSSDPVAGAGPPDSAGNPTAGVIWRAAESLTSFDRERALLLGARGQLGGGAEPGTEAEAAPDLGLGLRWEMPVPERMHISGEPILEAEIRLDRDDANFQASLQERTADGQIQIISFGLLSAEHAESLENPTPREPGRRYRYGLRLQPTDAWVEAGSTLQLDVHGPAFGMSSLNFYRMWVATDGSSVLRLPLVKEVCGINVIGARQQARAELIPAC